MSWFLAHFESIFAVLLPAYGLFQGRRLAARLWRDGWGPVSRETMLSAQGVGVIAFLIFVFYTPSITIPLRLSFLAALTGIYVPSLVVILTRPETPKAMDPEV